MTFSCYVFSDIIISGEDHEKSAGTDCPNSGNAAHSAACPARKATRVSSLLPDRSDVLVVEDDPKIVELLSLHLKDLGLSTEAV